MAKDLYILDLVTQESLEIQFVPQEIQYNPESTWVAIASSGRNNPLYHYTGSEDTLAFEIDWHAQIEDRDDVIAKCRWLESLTKNNGWDEPPHHVELIWGSLFGVPTSEWVVTAAPYKLSNFHRPSNMLPIQAYQQVTLKRITTTNRDYSEIRATKYAIPKLPGLQTLPFLKPTEE